MSPLRQRMLEDMQLRGLSARTQEAYARAVWQLSEHYHRSPAQLSDEELRQYFLYPANEKKFALPTTNRALWHQVLLRTNPEAQVARCASPFLNSRNNSVTSSSLLEPLNSALM
jgi:hypothetical protein